MREVLQTQEAPAAKSGRRRALWIRLSAPYVFNRFHFLVEVRVKDDRPAVPLGETDVRVLGPACRECGAPMTRVESAPSYERYACRRGGKHCEYWIGRVSHLGFSEFVAEHLRPAVYRAVLDGSLPIEAQEAAQPR